MEIYSKMSEKISSQSNNISISGANINGISFNAQNPDLNIQAHYSNDMKVKRVRRSVNNIPNSIPTHHLITPHEMDTKMRSINTDIYEGRQKEEANHVFNSKLYFKIFAGVTLFSAIIACIRKFR